MANYIIIDGGTTNTRIGLIVENKIIRLIKLNIGAKEGIDDRKILVRTIRQCINEILSTANISENEIKAIIASGMITSEFGLINLAHIPMPVGIEDLHNNLYRTYITEISTIPFVFVPGVKCHCESFENSDIMRGEETEFIGLFKGEGIYILPGSHTKIILADKEQRIIEFKTLLTGEMIYALCKSTVLKDSLDFENAEIDSRFIIQGYKYCRNNGINAALFKVRVLDKLFAQSKSELYSFFMGVVLCGEVEQILSSNPKRIVIAGQNKIKHSLAVLLESEKIVNVEIIDDDHAERAVMVGAIKIYEHGSDI